MTSVVETKLQVLGGAGVVPALLVLFSFALSVIIISLPLECAPLACVPPPVLFLYLICEFL